uniref:Uncharacterized protein n=1 Tax=Physcomitrium patens TaxID=3218 RepID=A0A2K1KCV7_PHYPA|nr:hypothetical protein PHYPA_010801 [Physcomitrium patens]
MVTALAMLHSPPAQRSSHGTQLYTLISSPVGPDQAFDTAVDNKLSLKEQFGVSVRVDTDFVSGFWVLRGGCSNLYSGSVELDCGRYPSLVGESGTVCGKGCWVAEIGAAEVLHSFEDCTVDHLLQLAKSFTQNIANGGGVLGIVRIKLQDILPEDGAASAAYTRAVEKLSLSLARNNAAIIQLSSEDAALVRCGLESAKLYFRSRCRNASLWNSSVWLKLSGYLAAPARDMYFYRAGRTLEGEETEPPPPCIPEVFKCLGKASRASLSGIARHLRLPGE